MENYDILADASADIDPAFIQSGEISIIPMRYMLGDEEKVCLGTESDTEKQKFYQAERQGLSVKSTQINPETYREIFEPLSAQGKNILYISLSGGLSQTYSSAVSAAKELNEKYPKSKIICIDSVAATVGMGILVERAAENKRNGMSLTENAANLEKEKYNICHWFTVNDLDFLKKGGRVPASLATLGKMLHIKPILRIDEEGKLGSFNKKIGLKFALNELIHLYNTHSQKEPGEKIRIVHCDCLAFAETVEKAILKLNPTAKITKMMMSPIIGIHVGYDVVGVVHFGNRKV